MVIKNLGQLVRLGTVDEEAQYVVRRLVSERSTSAHTAWGLARFIHYSLKAFYTDDEVATDGELALDAEISSKWEYRLH